ncbi:MAG: thioesterase family protein [Phycisphaerae bacterium]|nr:thioesterase family protein [Phycisphaerae bacterium]
MAEPHHLTVRVRYGEADPMGRLHHSHVLVYFEMGRTELLRERGLAYADMEARGRYVAIAEVCVRYRAAARYDEQLVVETRVREVRGARVEFANRLLREDAAGETLIAEAEITGALVDARGRPMRFTAEERALLLDS